MPPDSAILLEKGSPWSAMLVTAAAIWLPVLVVLLLLQRRGLNRIARTAMDRTLDDHASDPDGDRIMRICRLKLGPLTGGVLGALWIGQFWLLVMAAAVASRHVPLDILRLDDPAYLDALLVGQSLSQVVNHSIEALVTRSMIVKLGIPAILISLLALDQMVFRPRTRWLDEVRMRWWERAGSRSCPPPAAMVSVRKCSRARFSWLGLVCGCFWLLGKKLWRQGLVVFSLRIASGVVAVIALAVLSGLQRTSGTVPESSPPPVSMVVGFMLVGSVFFILNLLISLWVATKGTGMVAERRLDKAAHREPECG